MSRVNSAARAGPDLEFQDALTDSAVAIMRALAVGVHGPDVWTDVSDAFAALRRAHDLLAARPAGHADETAPVQ